jgi:hypothetical protein
LTAQNLEVVTLQGNDGEVSSALKLTDTLIWQLNKTFRCEFKIAKCHERILAIENRHSELDKKVQDLNDLLQLSTDDDDRAPLLRRLQDAEGMARCFNQVIAAVERKLKYWRELELPKSQMFHDVQQVMPKNNILDHISNQSDGCQTETAPSNGTEEQAQIAPTPSEIARRALANEHDAAIARVNTMQLRLQKFNDKFDNWNKY